MPAIKDMFVRVYGKVRQIWISYGNQTFVLEEPVDVRIDTSETQPIENNYFN